MNGHFQTGIHLDADELSVFMEGADTARERERMLAHLAECAECRKAVFLMQPREETRQATVKPVKEWIARRFLLVGLPAAALACGLIAVLVHIRPQGRAPRTPQQIASVRQPEIEHPETTAAPASSLEQGAPTANAGRAASINSGQVARSGKPQHGLASNSPATNLSRQGSPIASGANVSALKGEQATGNAAPQTEVAATPATAPVTGADAQVSGELTSREVVSVPLKGRNFSQLIALTPGDTKAEASRDSLAKKEDLPALQGQRAGEQAETLAGVSGRITDRSGAIIPGVTVTLRDAAGKTRQTTTGTDGSFHLTDLPPGQYGLTATASGFKTSKQSIELKPSELAMLQPVLDVGTAAEQVTVEAGSVGQVIETESATVSGTVTEKEVTNLGVNGRNFTQLLQIAGTVSHGKRVLSIDDAGNLFLSRNGGKKWKKVNPQWAGKAAGIELTSANRGEAPPKAKDKAGSASKGDVFQLTTDSGVVWTSKDGAHWHQQ